MIGRSIGVWVYCVGAVMCVGSIGFRVLVDEVVVGGFEFFWVIVLVMCWWMKVWSVVMVAQGVF